MTQLTAVGFDADDTLWHHERFFELTQQKFAELLRDYADPHHLSEHLLAAERRNVLHYGYGVKGFMLSMIETAVDVTDGKVPGHIIGQVLDAGRDMLRHPIEPLPHVEATLRTLATSHRLILITKGDLFDQERKLAASGLGEHFAAVEIVSDKTAEVYTRIFDRHAQGPARAMMVGNSLRSDIVPALEAGAWGVHVPSEHSWALDAHDEPSAMPRFRRIADLGALAPLVAEIGAAT
jgi:putative hydrolase of the HAD superfamily